MCESKFFLVRFFDEKGIENEINLFGTEDEIIQSLNENHIDKADYNIQELMPATLVKVYFEERKNKIAIDEFKEQLESLERDKEIAQLELDTIEENSLDKEDLIKELKSINAKILKITEKLNVLMIKIV